MTGQDTETERRQGCQAIGLGTERRGSQWGTEGREEDGGVASRVGARRAVRDYAARRTRVIIELGFSPDQSRQVNHWPPDRVLAKDRRPANSQAKRAVFRTGK